MAKLVKTYRRIREDKPLNSSMPLSLWGPLGSLSTTGNNKPSPNLQGWGRVSGLLLIGIKLKWQQHIDFSMEQARSLLRKTYGDRHKPLPGWECNTILRHEHSKHSARSWKWRKRARNSPLRPAVFVISTLSQDTLGTVIKTILPPNSLSRRNLICMR